LFESTVANFNILPVRAFAGDKSIYPEVQFMANKNSRLLTTEELWDIYAPPAHNQSDFSQHFTITANEIKTMKGFKSIEVSVYFVICLPF